MRLTCREKYQAVVRAQQHLNPSIQMCLNLPGLLGYVSEYIPFCCYCVSKSSCLELKMLTNRQSFQKIFLSWIILLPFSVCQLDVFTTSSAWVPPVVCSVLGGL